jgi:microcystin degradation protein MlrC
MLENAPAFTVLADAGDNVLAGAPGDSSAILERVLQGEYTNLSGAIPIVDPECVDALAGENGEQITIQVGGKLTPGLSPVDVYGEIVDVVTDSYELR